jgi:small subunit ribosomal protein S3
MGQKVNPNAIRIGITKSWDSKWYAGKKNFAKYLHQDLAIKKFIRKSLDVEGISRIEIMRNQGKMIVNIHTSKPGLIIGRGGEGVDKLKESMDKKFNINFVLNIKEIKKPMLDAQIVAEIMKNQVEKRTSYRRVAKTTIDKVMEAGALGVKVYLGGRLNGVEIARGEYFSKGKIPLHTFRADIDYCSMPASTT